MTQSEPDPEEQGDLWEQRFETEDYVFGTEPCGFLVRHAGLLRPGWQALAIADGEGRNSVFMAEKGLRVTAMDNSMAGLAKARRLAETRHVSICFRQQDLRRWNWQPARYDLVAAIFIQFAGPEFRAEIFNGIETTLKPGGLLMLHGFTPRQLEYGTGGPPCADQMYTIEMLSERFGGWNILRLAEYDADNSGGRGHTGRSALIDLIARRPAHHADSRQ